MNEVPPSWAAAGVLDIAELFRGVTYSKLDAADTPFDGSVPVLRANNIQGRTFDLHDLVYVPESLVAAHQFINKGDVVVAMSSGSINVVGKGAQATADMHAGFGAFCGVLRPRREIDARYFGYYFYSEAYRTAVSAMARGVSINNLRRDHFAALIIPIAPFNEQERISDKLDATLGRIDACRVRLDRVAAVLSDFRQSVLAAATSGKLTEEWRGSRNVGEWRNVRLGDIADIQSGVTKDTKKQTAEEEEVPYLRVANVQRGYLDLTKIKTIRVRASKLRGILLEPGDVLFNEGGDIDKLGRGWVWEGQIARCTFQNHVFRARLYEKWMQPKYISWWGNYRGLGYFLRAGKQTTNLASINKSILSDFPISLPPREEQAVIVSRVEALFAYADRLEARYAAARSRVERSEGALLAKAFRGELVPQNPNDEPASVLLKRILAARATTPAKSEQRKGAGYGRPKRAQKAQVIMLNRGNIRDSHLNAILKERGPLTSEALWTASQLDIDDFYDQLKDEEARGLLKEQRAASSTAPRLLEAVA